MDFSYIPVAFAVAACSIPLVYYLRRFRAGGVCRSRARIDGRVVIITGANSGIGKATAVDLARRGGRVYMACRDPARGQAALADVIRLSGSHDVHFMQLDLASLASVRAFVAGFSRAETRLDILVNNAAMVSPSFARTVDALEVQMATNHLGPFLLTNLLLDRLKAAGTAESNSRIVTVSSRGHTVPKAFDFDGIVSERERCYDAFGVYCQTKLANLLFTRQLAKRLAGSHVTANCLHPGAVSTGIARHFSGWKVALVSLVFYVVSKTPEQGAQTSIHCAVARELEGISGRYFSDCAVTQESPAARDDGAAARLWQLSAELVNL